MNYKQLKEKFVILEKENLQYEQRTKNLNTKIEQFTKQNIELEAENEDIESKYSEQEYQINELKMEKHKLSLSNKKLMHEYSKYAKQHKELKDELDKLIEINSIIEKKNKKLKSETDRYILKIEDMHIDLRYMEERNKSQIKQISELLIEHKFIEEEAKRVKKHTSLTDIKIEAKNYLKGTFGSFISESNSLLILINNTKYYYPLDSYQCSYLPISGSRILIFKAEDGESLIYGFDMESILNPAKKIKAEVKSILKTQQKIKLHNKQLGYINVIGTGNDKLYDSINLGEQITLKQINIDGDFYFCIDKTNKNQYDRLEILKTLKRS